MAQLTHPLSHGLLGTSLLALFSHRHDLTITSKFYYLKTNLTKGNSCPSAQETLTKSRQFLVVTTQRGILLPSGRQKTRNLLIRLHGSRQPPQWPSTQPKEIVEAFILFPHLWQKDKQKLGVVAHSFNASTQEAEVGRARSSRPVWLTYWVPVQAGLYRDTLSQETNEQTTTNKNYIQL